jgi:hypothetical protein
MAGPSGGNRVGEAGRARLDDATGGEGGTVCAAELGARWVGSCEACIVLCIDAMPSGWEAEFGVDGRAAFSLLGVTGRETGCL